jgi:hypothetical protein
MMRLDDGVALPCRQGQPQRIAQPIDSHNGSARPSAIAGVWGSNFYPAAQPKPSVGNAGVETRCRRSAIRTGIVRR